MLSIHLDDSGTSPLYEQIYHSVKIKILSGELTAGDKLPSSRSFAAFLGVSRNTVEIAFAQLLAEGYLESKERCGYFISQITHTQTFSTQSSNTVSNTFSQKETSFQYDFAPNSIDISHFPVTVWSHLAKNNLYDCNLLLQGHNQGDEKLRGAIASYLHGSRSVNCIPEQIIVGAGMDYLLQLLSLILGRGRKMAIENPCYQQARHIFQRADYQIIDIPLDTDGIQMNPLYKSSANCCYVTPSHQYPLGLIMPITRRQELLYWASQNPERYIIEDDHDSEFRYKGKPIPSLQGMDTEEKVIYIGTFSKAIAPSLRVGYMVLPKPLLSVYHEHFSFYSCTVSRFEQSIISDFITKGYFEKHLNRMRKLYKSKHDQTISLLKDKLNGYHILGEYAGLYIIIQANKKEGLTAKANQTFENKQIHKAMEYGIRLYGLSGFYTKLPEDYHAAFLIGFAALTDVKLSEGLILLCEKILA